MLDLEKTNKAPYFGVCECARIMLYKIFQLKYETQRVLKLEFMGRIQIAMNFGVKKGTYANSR